MPAAPRRNDDTNGGYASTMAVGSSESAFTQVLGMLAALAAAAALALSNRQIPSEKKKHDAS